MSRRSRSLAFLTAAIICAALAAALVDGYRDQATVQYGQLRRVVVAGRDLPAGQAITSAAVQEALSVRRVPAGFVPPGVLLAPNAALGLAPATPIPAGSYVTSAALTPAAPKRPRPRRLGGGRRPVEIAVSGGEALTVSGPPEGSLVDVVVAEDRGISSQARIYMAASRVPLLTLSRAGDGTGTWHATLALTRAQALELIGAEASGAQIRLLPFPV